MTRTQRGGLMQAEAMLMNQATALQSLFARLAEHAFSVAYSPYFDSLMRMRVGQRWKPYP